MMYEEKYVSAKYISEKMRPIENLIDIVNNAERDNLAEEIRCPEEIAFAFAVIAKEIGVEIPEV